MRDSIPETSELNINMQDELSRPQETSGIKHDMKCFVVLYTAKGKLAISQVTASMSIYRILANPQNIRE
jgi:hypothetical protein